jgi:hypothetical protein
LLGCCQCCRLLLLLLLGLVLRPQQLHLHLGSIVSCRLCGGQPVSRLCGLMLQGGEHIGVRPRQQRHQVGAVVRQYDALILQQDAEDDVHSLVRV